MEVLAGNRASRRGEMLDFRSVDPVGFLRGRR
jgi:hypothetical protein